MVKGVIAFIIILTAACVAESITMPQDKIPPVVTLIQNEPEYFENTDIVGAQNEVNMEKFSNPVVSSGGSGAPASFGTSLPSSLAPAAQGRLTKSKGVHQGPSGVETYYNLDMSRCVEIMRDLGFSEEEYPYWIRDDGAKMLGPYVMIAAKLDIRPKGTIIETSLGLGIVSDTAAKITYKLRGDTHIDVACDW